MHFRPRLLCGEIVYVFRLGGIVHGAASLACGVASLVCGERKYNPRCG